MPFPVVFTSSAPAGGRPSADFGGPVLFGKISDAGPIGTGPQPQPSGSLYVQSTGGPSNQVVKFASISKASLGYTAVSTLSLVSASAPPFTGFGAATVFVDDGLTPHMEAYSTVAGSWVAMAGGGGGNVSIFPPLTGTINVMTKWGSTSGGLTDSNVLENGTLMTVTSSVGVQAAYYNSSPVLTADPSNPSAGLTLYAIVTTSGKVQLRVMFPSGNAQAIATED